MPTCNPDQKIPKVPYSFPDIRCWMPLDAEERDARESNYYPWTVGGVEVSGARSRDQPSACHKRTPRAQLSIRVEAAASH